MTNTYAIDAASGEALWKFRANTAWPSAPVVTEKLVLFTSSDRAIRNSIILHALDRFTGRQLWRYETKGGEDFWKLSRGQTPLAAQEKTAILTTDAFIVGLALDTGKELWRWDNARLKKPVNQAYLGPLLYVVTGDTLAPMVGDLHAINTETGTTAWTKSMYSPNKIQ
jgi:outer membrane protein assembly factor BamB